MQQKSEWVSSDFSYAMLNAIESSTNVRKLDRTANKISFNGFWRNGRRLNVCAWLDEASWYDAKTGDKGRCQEFASVAFNMNLPQFMLKFGKRENMLLEEIDIAAALAGKHLERAEPTIKLTKSVDKIWQELCRRDRSRPDQAAEWLTNERGFEAPRAWIGSGFTNLGADDIELFEPIHHSLIKHRLSLGPQLVAPIRGVHSGEVKNLFFRAMDDVDKGEKSRLLTGAGGWQEPDATPRAFGFPHLIKDFPNIALCEGMADYFAAELLLGSDEKWLPFRCCQC